MCNILYHTRGDLFSNLESKTRVSIVITEKDKPSCTKNGVMHGVPIVGLELYIVTDISSITIPTITQVLEFDLDDRVVKFKSGDNLYELDYLDSE